jgi:hypothetical protein
VQHLVHGDAQERSPPARDRRRLVVRQPVTRTALEAVGREEVAAQDAVLDLRRLREQIGELLTMMGDDRRFSHGIHDARRIAARRPW